MRKIDDRELAKIKYARWRARSDLIFLCREVLNYPDVDEFVHGPVTRVLQQFPFPDPDKFWSHDRYENGKWIYEPLVPMLDLPGKRRTLILDARGHLKTTINVIAHTIQWIINYPDCAILIVQANIDKAVLCLGEIKRHFQTSPVFRALFPEHCPKKNVMEWGTQTAFTTEARRPTVIRKEPTVMVASIDKGTAGIHCDVIKFSDIVEENNSRTADQCEAVTRSFRLMENLLVSPVYWIDVEGTRYHHADLYGRIIQEEWAGVKPEARAYNIFVRSCFKRKTPDGGPQIFVPEELEYPFLLDSEGRRIPWWPKDRRGNLRFPLEHLERMEKRDPYLFSCQQLNCPSSGTGQKVFPVDENYPKWISREVFEQRIRIVGYDIAVDTAESDSPASNYTAIAVGAWSANGKCYIVEIVHGKFLADKLVREIADVAEKYKHRLMSIKIERTAYVRGLFPSLQRYLAARDFHLPIELIPVDNRRSKIERITNTLQPWYKAGDLVFLDDLEPKDHLLRELREFPLSATDDILDAISDLFQNKTWFGRQDARPLPQREMDLEWQKFVGLADQDQVLEESFRGTHAIPIPGMPDPYSRTGGL